VNLRPLLASLATTLALCACSDALPDKPMYRNSFSSGQAGWDQFEALASVDDSDLGKVHSVKMLVFDVQTAPKVYFIDSKKYLLHYDFAHALDSKRFPTRAIFDTQVYWDPQHKHAMATLLWYKDLTTHSASLPPTVSGPISLQFFPSDNQPAANARRVYQLARDRMPMLPPAGTDRRLVYTPTNATQQNLLEVEKNQFDSAGVSWLTQVELYADLTLQACNPGITFGTLRQVSPEQLLAGGVSYRDIVLLDRLPLDLPLVGGTITEEFQTPLAHVNLVAKAHKTPNLALRHASTDPRVQPLVGKLVRFEVFPGGFDLREATSAEVNAFWKKKLDRPEWKPITDLKVVGVTDLDQVGFGSSSAFGVKTSNYAELRRLFAALSDEIKELTGAFQDNFTPAGLAVPFSAYEDHITLAAHVTPGDCGNMQADCALQGDLFLDPCQRAADVCKDVATNAAPANLKDYMAKAIARPDFAADSALRDALLHGFRWQIENTPLDATFAKSLDDTVAGKFSKSPMKVRLRSSTNAEDLPGFSGAGLYASFSAKNLGTKDRPSSVIGKTWGSVWSFRAFEERSFWRISHLDVRMGVLIHQSFPEEVCNGVIITKNVSDPTSWGYYVNVQKGEESVTNPVGGITPEAFTVYWNSVLVNNKWKLQALVDRSQYSSLSPDAALMDDTEIARLTQAMNWAHSHFKGLYGKDVTAFDAEFKLYGKNRDLYIKQIRPY